MPGMMDTILNLGLNDQTVEALARKTNNPRFAWDCYRRFVQMYGDVVLGVQKRPDEDHEPFEVVIEGSSTSATTRPSRTPSSPSKTCRSSSPASSAWSRSAPARIFPPRRGIS
jgi:hypothetical protein